MGGGGGGGGAGTLWIEAPIVDLSAVPCLAAEGGGGGGGSGNYCASGGGGGDAANGTSCPFVSMPGAAGDSTAGAGRAGVGSGLPMLKADSTTPAGGGGGGGGYGRIVIHALAEPSNASAVVYPPMAYQFMPVQ
jgi:hypothetical protein